MLSTQVPLVYDELLDYLLEKAKPEEILDFKVSEKANAREADLLDRSNAGRLTTEEALELQQMLYFDSRISVLKTQAALIVNVSPYLS